MHEPRRTATDSAIVYRVKMHVLPFVAAVVLAFFALIVFLIASQAGSSEVAAIGALVLLLVAFELLLFLSLRRLTTECLLTRDHLVLRKGLLARRVARWPLTALEKVEVQQSFIGRLLHFGTMVIEPRGGKPSRLPFVAAPRVILRLLGEHTQTAAAGPG